MGKDWKGSARSVFVTMGSSNHSIEKRAELDYYATHPEASMWLLKLVPLHDRIWECAYGEGHLAMELEASGREVMKSDITDRTGSTEVIDFLNYKCDNMGGVEMDIVTNPPYAYAQEFVEKALEVVADGYYVCMFLPIRYLEGRKRRVLFDKFPPQYVYVSSSRIVCAKNGDFKNTNGSSQGYCWMIWLKGWKGDTVLRWFN